MRPILAVAATIAAFVAVACSSPDESRPATATPSPIPNPAPFTGVAFAPLLEAPATPAEPVSTSGTGSGTATVGPLEPGVWWVDFTHTGSGTFDVTVHDGAESEIILVSAGDYTGRHWLPGGTSYLFDIDASEAEPWNILLRPIGPQPAAANSLSGTGDLVSGYFTPAVAGAVSWNFIHDGDDEYSVQLYCDNGYQIPVLEFGPVSLSSVVTFPTGARACFWDINGYGGTWSLAAGEPVTVTTTPPPAVDATPAPTISDAAGREAFTLVFELVWNDEKMGGTVAQFLEAVPWIADVHTELYDPDTNTIVMGANIPDASAFAGDPQRWRDESWPIISLYSTALWKSYVDGWGMGESSVTPDWPAWTPSFGIGTSDRQLLVLCPGPLIYALSQGQAGRSEFDQQCTFVPE